jgi:hypothetical protein
MARPDLRTRQAKAAQAYMHRKGFLSALPFDVIDVEASPCWYFYYNLPDGCLELEVAWENDTWNYAVTAFLEGSDRMIDPVGR